ncbi:S-adenosyl-L-methionine-dependent methyltransferase [Synechococcus sp. A15-127]|uniref:class I SAM-dependent methyltransferase n=1 Tax=Synechococcus sp. A15-127 TaxID=1050624 RepID=UPI0016459765|nr:class I SAM-dependent methyltransferase [Synechococcus sp. A15-127]QNI95409.1 S-adenosyl-L-methionine-dependent methyltransferase [Synechococcus sp. A15-127]
MKCRHCGTPLTHTFLDLGFAPPSNAYLSNQDLACPETYYPLKIKVCDVCWLVQTEDYAQADELFRSDYAYFSSTSTGWLAHAASYADNIIKSLSLDQSSHVVEIASNDGYLLKNFLSANIPCLGIEPTESTASESEKLGIPVLREFFGEELGLRLSANNLQADLIIGNNVFAHVPDINDFTRGLKALLKKSGTITLEFPHLLCLINNSQFDTVYHEHFSYFSLHTVQRIFNSAGLRVLNVEKLTTHGGSLRVYGCHFDDIRETCMDVSQIIETEIEAGLQNIVTYQNFQIKADCVKDDLLSFLVNCKRSGKKVAAYGAAAKGNTLLNYAGVKPDLLSFVCDAALSKQGKYMPGSHIPILAPDALRKYRPDYVIILPWNLSAEVIAANDYVHSWGGIFVTAVPNLHLHQ